MPALSWNEIRQRAIQFSRDWEGASREKAEAQTFWNEFFDVFGVRRRTVASFEEPVKTIKDTYGHIDLFWRGRLLAEHKSRGGDLGRAKSQAFRYIQDLISEGRSEEVPRYVLVTDFAWIILYDLEPDEHSELFRGKDCHYVEFEVASLHLMVRHFAFLIGQKTHRFGEEDPANLEAAQLMADLHDAVADGGYPQQQLERLLVRILFCLFAEDTGVFEPAQFELFVENHTRSDGGDLGFALSALFEILDTPEGNRQSRLDEDLKAFPYIDGELFAGRLPLVAFDRQMRDRLVAACRFDWSRILPAIFGSLFQGIMDAKERRQIGAHYTSERDILKVIRPLFLDALHEEFGQIKRDRSTRRRARLIEFQKKLASLKMLDPACGCGNFLVVAYRELRRIELDVLKLLHPHENGEQELDLGELAKLSQVDVDQFYGIEIGKWPARIAETALWLTDHQMNTELSLAFGNLFQRIPLKASPHIRCTNALRMEWNDLLPAAECSYVFGNPPFVGKQFQTAEQKEDIRRVTGSINGTGILDYVTCWYFMAAKYIAQTNRRCAFVSTNSITQGEQAAVFWERLLAMGVHIHFAHRTFAWQSEARGKAHVHVVVVGFGLGAPETCTIFDYETPTGEPKTTAAAQINPYLVDAPMVVVRPRSAPLCDVPRMRFGSMPNDGGHLLLDRTEYEAITAAEPALAPYIRPFLGSQEYINGIERYCFWLVNVPSALLKSSRILSDRIKAVREARLASARETTRALAATPYLFGEIRHPDTDYLLVPQVSSERRTYLPMGFVPQRTIASNLCNLIPNATVWHFGVLASGMHMAWLRQVCGRLKSDLRYSAKLVYNNFPWPRNATVAQREKVEICAHAVLTVRQRHLDAGLSLADVYDPLYMPADLLKAHQALDRSVDKCYRRESFKSDRERVEYLFRLYEELTAPLVPAVTARRNRARRR